MTMTLTGRLAVTASLALFASGAMAVPMALDTTSVVNGLTDVYSTTFDGARTPCNGSSPTYCTFFGGDPTLVRAITLSPDPTGVNTGSPLAIGTPHTAAGSFLDISLTGGNTTAQIIGTSTISIPNVTLNISIGATVVTTSGVGFAILPTGTAAVNGSGQVEFFVDNNPAVAADFSTLGAVVTGCTGGLCAALGSLTLDMVRYRLFLDFDPTFTSFTGDFIGQTANGSMIFATLNSAPPVPVPAAVWLMGSGLALLGALRRKASAA
ncbi:MAG: hypothetical protein ABL989_15305 [Gammaproteobacteria bacterium]